MNPQSEPQDTPQSPHDRLVHCSAERTLVARRQGEETVLVKLFESGSVLDAEQEADTAQRLRHPGVVAYRSGGVDPVTRKPCVIMDYCAGDTWELRVGRYGPFAPRQASRLAAQLARILADFHALRLPTAPTGMVHRDIKPANLMLDEDKILVMDLEHATPAGTGGQGTEAFTGGTHGFSPPEAYGGATPNPAFDVFGLGATLFYLVTGSAPFTRGSAAATIDAVRRDHHRPGLLRGLPAPLVEVILACLSPDPTARPDAGAVAASLEVCADRIDAAAAQVLKRIQAGALDDAARALGSAPGAAPVAEASELRDLLARRRQGHARLGPAPRLSVDELLQQPELLAPTATRLRLRLRHFPADAEARESQRNLACALHAFLTEVPPRVQKAKMEAAFTEAHALLDLAERAAAIIPSLPGGLDEAVADAGTLPGLLLRNPGQLLAHARRDLQGMAEVHERLMARLLEAESNLQLAPARDVVAECAAIYGGASVVAAPLKDRLLRLEFYLDRLARAPAMLSHLEDQLNFAGLDHDLATVTAFSARCADEHPAESTLRARKGRVRGLQDALRQLVEDFPHAEPTVAAPAAALHEAMATLTALTWDLLEETEDKLGAVPIPIRLVQKLLNRLDTIRMMEALVDLPDRSRESLQDRIERCRMHLDQARNTRDNLARGAEAAMERGHLTTALYDMERAVDRFEDDAEEESEGQPLAARLEEAKRRKKSLEQRIVENQQLATAYMEILDADRSTLEERAAMLQKRAEVLESLIDTLGQDKGQHYVNDLRDVLFHRVQILTEVGEEELRQHTDAESRLKAVSATLAAMHAATAEPSTGQDLGGRIRRLFDQWQQRERELRNELRAAETQAKNEARRRRRLAWFAAAGLLFVSLAAVGTWQVVEAQATAAPRISYDPMRQRLERSGDSLLFPKVPVFLRLNNFLAALQAAGFDEKPLTTDLDLPGRSQRLLSQLGDLMDDQKSPDEAWAADFRTACTRFDEALIQLGQRMNRDESWLECLVALRRFGSDCHLAGLSLAATSPAGRVLLPDLLTAASQLRQIDLTPADHRRLRATLAELKDR